MFIVYCLQSIRRRRIVRKEFSNGVKGRNYLTGFTYIELLITLAVIAVLFVPIMQLFSNLLFSSEISQNLITATNLAKWQMERIKNLHVSKAQLKEMGDSIYPPLKEAPLEMNKTKWRIKNEIIKDTDPLEIRVSVYVDSLPGFTFKEKPLVTLVTLREDMFWEQIKAVK